MCLDLVSDPNLRIAKFAGRWHTRGDVRRRSCLTITAWPGPTYSANSYVQHFYASMIHLGINAVDADLRSVLRKNDLIHVHWPEGFQSFSNRRKALRRLARLLGVVWYARLRGIPVAWTAHNLAPQMVRYPVLQHLLEHTFFPNVSLVLLPSRWAALNYRLYQARHVPQDVMEVQISHEISHGTYVGSQSPKLCFKRGCSDPGVIFPGWSKLAKYGAINACLRSYA